MKRGRTGGEFWAGPPPPGWDDDEEINPRRPQLDRFFWGF